MVVVKGGPLYLLEISAKSITPELPSTYFSDKSSTKKSCSDSAGVDDPELAMVR